MTLRPLDATGMREYVNELRPRMLAIHIRAEKVNIRWWIPVWAFEESLRFLLRLLPLARAAAPTATTRLLTRLRIPLDMVEGEPARTELWQRLDELFSEADRDLLELPGDVPFVDVKTNDVRVYIGQIRL